MDGLQWYNHAVWVGESTRMAAAMNHKVQTILMAVLVFIVFSATAAYVTVNFDSFWSRDEAVGTQRIDQFSDIRNQQQDEFQLGPQSTPPLAFFGRRSGLWTHPVITNPV